MSGLLIRFGSKELDDAVGAMTNQDDRSMVIVASSILENHLLSAIESRFVNRDKHVEGIFFKGYGPISSFRSRIDLAFFLGVYSKKAHSRMHRVREIRNRMAHQIKPHDFATQEIKDQMQHFPRRDEVLQTWEATAKLFAKMQKGKKDELDNDIDADIFFQAVNSIASLPQDMRGNFLAYIQNRCMALICAAGATEKTLSFLFEAHL